jgi:hypothetical protein
VGRVWGYIEYNDLIIPVVELELGGVVAFIAVEDQQPVYTLYLGYYIVVKVLDLVKANYIGSPAIIGSCDTLVEW